MTQSIQKLIYNKKKSTKEEEIEFNKVLNKGQFFINFPAMFVMFGFMWLSYYLNTIELISKTIMIIGFVISFILGWLVWSFFIPKWRIWAFEKIDEQGVMELEIKLPESDFFRILKNANLKLEDLITI